MAKRHLVIVESPAKARTIHRILGSKFEVTSSMGHLRDLPASRLGVDVENNFEPHYIVIQKRRKFAKQLQELARDRHEIYLAPDPDREGEAISWHLAQLLKEDDEKQAAKRAKLPRGGTLQTTALVHEAYLRIADKHPSGWEGRAHFFFTAARAMRDILVEDARRRSRQKHGGDREQVSLDDIALTLEPPVEELLALDAALTKLEEEDPESHRLVLLRYFTGLTVPEAAAVLGVSVSTVERKWRFLRTWLSKELDLDPPS